LVSANRPAIGTSDEWVLALALARSLAQWSHRQDRGMLVEFASVAEPVICAVAVQARWREQNEGHQHIEQARRSLPPARIEKLSFQNSQATDWCTSPICVPVQLLDLGAAS
jgi:hypothetical protein